MTQPTAVRKARWNKAHVAAGSRQNLLTGFILPHLNPSELQSLCDAAAAYVWSMILPPVYSSMEMPVRIFPEVRFLQVSQLLPSPCDRHSYLWHPAISFNSQHSILVPQRPTFISNNAQCILSISKCPWAPDSSVLLHSLVQTALEIQGKFFSNESL